MYCIIYEPTMQVHSIQSRNVEIAHIMQSLDCTKVVYVKCRQNVANELGECGALSGEREQVVWSICVAQAIKCPFQSPSSQSAHNVYTGNEIII